MLHQLPSVCLGEIATYLDGESLLSLLLCSKDTNVGIIEHKDYIQSQRTYVTFTANPYRHCVFKNTNQLPQPLLAFDVLDEVQDMCDTGNVFEEEIITPYPACFQWRLDNGKNGRYITQLLIKSTFDPDGYIWIRYGNNAVDVRFLNIYMNLLERDNDGFYHLFLDKMLLIPKLVRGFDDESSYFLIEVKSVGITTLRVIRQEVNTNKAKAFINKYKNNQICMPRVKFMGWWHCQDTVSANKVHNAYFDFASGNCVAICVDIRSLIDNNTIQNELIDEFQVHMIKRGKVIDTFSIKANMVHSTLVQKFNNVVSWGWLTFKDCFIIPIYGNYKIDHLRVDVLLKSPMEVKVNAMYLHNYEYTYFSL